MRVPEHGHEQNGPEYVDESLHGVRLLGAAGKRGA